MRLPVSKTSLKEAGEGGDGVEVRVIKSMVGGDSVSPHQIPHTEIVEWEVGHRSSKDMLRGGIWSMAISGVMPGTGGPPPDTGIGVDATLRSKKRAIIPRDMGIVALVLLGIRLGGVAGHLLAWLVSDEGDDGIIPQKPSSLI